MKNEKYINKSSSSLKMQEARNGFLQLGAILRKLRNVYLWVILRMEALHILLRRLSSPNRYIDLAQMFQLRPQYLSVVFTGTIAFLFNKWGNFIRYLGRVRIFLDLDCRDQ